jgi:uncharacterized OB-fold protein
MTMRFRGAVPLLYPQTPDRWTAPFWEAAREHRLVCQRCADCGTFRMPPAPVCFVCQSVRDEWPELPGRGSVYSFTVVWHAPHPELQALTPYAGGIIELDGAEGARLFGNIVDINPQEVVVGLPVHVVWDDIDRGVTVARWAPEPKGT